MLVRGWTAIAYGLFDAVFRPSRFVGAQTTTYSTSRVASLRQVGRLTAVLGLNLALYALPLTLAGIGFTTNASAPPWFAGIAGSVVASPDTAWQLVVGFVQNSAFLTVATVVAFVTFHGSVLAARRSRGFVQSFHTVVYTSSAYLAGMFTIVMYLSTTPGLARTREFVINLQANFIYWVIDLMGVDLVLPGVNPGPLTAEGITGTGATLLALLVLLTLYFFYSMYLGARANHQMGRIDSGIVVVGVLASPVIYVAGSILTTVLFQTYGIQVF